MLPKLIPTTSNPINKRNNLLPHNLQPTKITQLPVLQFCPQEILIKKSNLISIEELIKIQKSLNSKSAGKNNFRIESLLGLTPSILEKHSLNLLQVLVTSINQFCEAFSIPKDIIYGLLDQGWHCLLLSHLSALLPFASSFQNDQFYSLISPIIHLHLNSYEQWSLGCTLFFQGKDIKNKQLNSLLNEIGEKAALSLVKQILGCSQQQQSLSKILNLIIKIMSVSEENVQKILLPNLSLEEIHKIWRK